MGLTELVAQIQSHQGQLPKDIALPVRHRGQRHITLNRRARCCGNLGFFDRRCAGLFDLLLQAMLFRANLCEELLALVGLTELVAQIQSPHGVFGVQHRAPILGCDFGRGEAVRQSGTAYQQGYINASSVQILRCDDHLLGGFHQQSGQADIVGLFFVVCRNQRLRWHFDTEINHLETIIT